MGSIIMHAPITTDRKTVRNVKMLEQRTKTGGFLFSHVTVFIGVTGFVLYCTSITRRISSGKGNHTNEKLEAKNDKRSPATLQDWRGQPPWRG